MSYGGSPWAAAFCGLWCAVFLVLGLLPEVRTGADTLELGADHVPWQEILRVDSTRWTSPLVLKLTLRSGRMRRLLYSGSSEDCDLLRRRIRRLASNALIDGVPHRQYWGLSAPIQAGRAASRPAPGRLLPEQDEAEVERLFQELRSRGRLGPRR